MKKHLLSNIIKTSFVGLAFVWMMSGAISVSANEQLSDMLSSMMEKQTEAAVDANEFIPGTWYLSALGEDSDNLQTLEAKDSYLEADHFYYTLTLQGKVVSEGLWQAIDGETNAFLFVPDTGEEIDEENVLYYMGNLSVNEETQVPETLLINMEGYYLFFEKDETGLVKRDDAEQMLTGTPEEIYEQILSSEYMSLDTALLNLKSLETEDEQIRTLQKKLEEMQLCQGVYIQEQEEDSSGKTYTATIEFYLTNGETFCSVDYTNYAGELDDAAAEVSEEDEYLFVTRPTGQFFSNTSEFEIQMNEEKVRIQWGDVCDYTLYRSEGSQEELEDKTVPFEESEIYGKIIDLLDSYFGKMAKHYVYDEEEKTVYAYVRIVFGLKDRLLQDPSAVESSWNDVTASIVDLSGKISDVTTLATRDGFRDYSEAHCTIMIVDAVNDEDVYSKEDVLAIITDGELVYDFLKDIAEEPAELPEQDADSFTYDAGADSYTSDSYTSESYISDSDTSGGSAGYDIYESSGSATMGERNALESAKSYLNYMAFSYTGLIEQLEYEGYSYSEAKYAVDHCGADWYEQAVKSARSYLDYMSFSRSGLIEQLEYEGFTHDQAVYGVTQNGY